MNNMNTENKIGKTMISPDVLKKVAYLTTLSVQGVSRMAGKKFDFDHFVNRQEDAGARVQVRNSQVFVEIYVILMSGMNVRDISREIQSRVSRAISEMVGMDVGGVNVHIMDIDFNT